MLTNCEVIDADDEYCEIGENITFECLAYMLAKVIKEFFDAKYFKQSTQIDLKKQQSGNVERGSTSMFFCGIVWIIIGKFALLANQVHSLKKTGDKLTTMEAIVNQDCEYNMCILDCPKVTMI
jgi:hypothetical protein